MKTSEKIVAGVVGVAALGAVGVATLPDEIIDNTPNIPIEVVEIAKEADIPSETKVCYGGLTCEVIYFKTYRSEDGATRDTPKAGYTLVTEKEEMIKQTTIIETKGEKTARLAANEKVEEEAKVEQENEAIYRQIGELEVLKLGGKKNLDGKINKLKKQLK